MKAWLGGGILKFDIIGSVKRQSSRGILEFRIKTVAVQILAAVDSECERIMPPFAGVELGVSFLFASCVSCEMCIASC